LPHSKKKVEFAMTISS